MTINRRPNSLRHPCADYSDPGAYFVTLCTHDRLPLFGEITDGKFHGNDYSRIVWEIWRSIPDRYPQISIDAAIVMPDHFHGIIIIHEQPTLNIVGAVHEPPLHNNDGSFIDAGNEPPLQESPQPHPQPRRIMTIPLVIGYLKMNTAKQINTLRGTPGDRLWQRGYYDRIVRIEKEYNALTEYILTNPERWGVDQDRTQIIISKSNSSRKGTHTCPSGQRQGKPCELPYLRNRRPPMPLIIRPERPEDHYQTEHMTQKAFWNLHNPGCSEHLLVHKLRNDPAYLPELSRVAELDGKVVGAILYSRSRVQDGAATHDVLTFGPLCVEPSLQRTGIGGKLMQVTFELARTAGWKAIIIFGEPSYYPKFGFVTCDHFGITTADGKNFDAFMALELVPGGLAGVHGKFHEAAIFENLPDAEVDEYSKRFPPLEKLRLPGQWGYEEPG